VNDASQLQNPYAFIDTADESGQPYYASGATMPWHALTAHATSPNASHEPAAGFASWAQDEAAKLRFGLATSGNPYARIDAYLIEPAQDGQPTSRRTDVTHEARLSAPATRNWGRALTNLRSIRRARPSIEDINVKARDLQQALWRHRQEIWGTQVPNDPLHVLDPAKALEWLGYRVRYRPGGLGQMQRGRQRIEVAGLLDPVTRTVDISTLPSVLEQTFTLAHELGHVVLDNVSAVAHRDRALIGEAVERDPIERATDQFAAAFLMPERLVRDLFRRCFLTDAFTLNDDTAFALCTANLDAVQDRLPTRRHLARWLASTERYNGRNFRSLSSRFKVSDGAMAIRLEELGLVAF
jgi:hypothetical protein